MRERPHVARALHVVLTAQRVHAGAGLADIAAQHREVRDRHHGGRALRMLGHAQPVIDAGAGRSRIGTGGLADQIGRNLRQFLDLFRGMFRVQHEFGIGQEFVPVAAFTDERLVVEFLGDDDMRKRGDDSDVGARPQRQMHPLAHMRRAEQVDFARVDDDQAGTLPQPFAQARAKDRVAVGRIGADDQRQIGILDRVKVMRPGRGAERGLQPVAGRRMADPGAGVGVVVAKYRTRQLLDQIGFFVRAARRGDDADAVAAVIGLRLAQAARGKTQRLVPADHAPRIGDLFADHRFQLAVLMGGIAPGKAALDAAMAPVGLAVHRGHHPHDFLAAHMHVEGAADAAIGAGRLDDMLGGADLDHLVLDQGGGRADLHAGAARHAIRGQEAVAFHARRDPAVKAAPLDGQGEGALHLFAGADAAVADDAFRRIEGEIGVRLILGPPFRVRPFGAALGEMVRARLIAHLAQAHGARHVLQFAIAIGRAGQAVERVVADVKLHHPLADLRDLVGLGVDDHAFGHRRGAGCGRAAHALDLHDA